MRGALLLTAASVVGAVAVGGAVTGSTLALWQDQRSLPAASVTAGTFGLDVRGQASATLDNLTGLQLGVRQAQPIRFISTGTGRNLLMNVRLLSVTESNPTGVSLLIQHRARSGAGDDCTGGAYTILSAGSTLASSIPAGGSAEACLGVTLQGAYLPPVATSSLVTLTFEGVQQP